MWFFEILVSSINRISYISDDVIYGPLTNDKNRGYSIYG